MITIGINEDGMLQLSMTEAYQKWEVLSACQASLLGKWLSIYGETVKPEVLKLYPSSGPCACEWLDGYAQGQKDAQN